MTLTSGAATLPTSVPARTRTSVRERFFSDGPRTIQTLLGLLWLLDGALALQPFTYSQGFAALLRMRAAGQPQWLRASAVWAADAVGAHLTLIATVIAAIQVLIGLGLLYRPTVRAAILASCAWAFAVWWFGEDFGMIFTAGASPLTGAPGAACLYPLIGLICWPNGRPGGLLGVGGTRTLWAALWLALAVLWLTSPSSSPDYFRQAFDASPSGMSWLSQIQYWAAAATAGAGVPLALALSLVSAVIGIGVYRNWAARPLLLGAATLNLAYWVLGQGFGGIFIGRGTDPSTGPLVLLLSYALYTLIDQQQAGYDAPS